MASDPSLPPPHVPPQSQEPQGDPAAGRSPRDRVNSIDPRLAGALGVALVVAVVLYLLLRGGGAGSGNAGSASTPAPAPAAPAVTRTPPVATTLAALRTLSASLGHPIYWAGPPRRQVLALQQGSDGSVFLRYLPRGTPLDSPAQQWLTVVTYKEPGRPGGPDAYALAQQGARRPGAQVRHLSDGSLAVSPPNLTTNAFLSRPGSPVLVEIYDPVPSSSLRDAASGRVRPAA